MMRQFLLQKQTKTNMAYVERPSVARIEDHNFSGEISAKSLKSSAELPATPEAQQVREQSQVEFVNRVVEAVERSEIRAGFFEGVKGRGLAKFEATDPQTREPVVYITRDSGLATGERSLLFFDLEQSKRHDVNGHTVIEIQATGKAAVEAMGPFPAIAAKAEKFEERVAAAEQAGAKRMKFKRTKRPADASNKAGKVEMICRHRDGDEATEYTLDKTELPMCRTDLEYLVIPNDYHNGKEVTKFFTKDGLRTRRRFMELVPPFVTEIPEPAQQLVEAVEFSKDGSQQPAKLA